jgi:hypothetical protein
MTRKQVCDGRHCDWHGTSDEVLRAKNPFDTEEEIWGCPKCKSIDSLYLACDEPGCWKMVSCGTPTPSGYRSTCGKHRPVAEADK